MTILLKDISFLCSHMTAFCFIQCIRSVISSNFLSLLHVITYFSFSSFCFITCQVKARFVSFSTMFSFFFIFFIYLHVITYFSFSSFLFFTCQVKAGLVSFSTMFSFFFFFFFYIYKLDITFHMASDDSPLDLLLLSLLYIGWVYSLTSICI